MTFDDQLQQVFDTLTDRLRDDIARELKETAADLAVHARTARETAVDEAATRASTEAQREAEARLVAEVAAAEARAREEAEKQVEQRSREMVEAAMATSRGERRSADLAASQRLVEAIRALDGGRSLTDILDTLASCASREAPRVAVLLAGTGELRGWRFIGFGPAFDVGSTVIVSLEEGGLIAEAVRTSMAVSSDASGTVAAPVFAALPGGRECAAVPVTMGGETVAVLYADRGTSDEEDQEASAPTWPDALELLARHAARCLEATTAIKAMRMLSKRPDALPHRASQVATVSRASQNDEDEAARRYALLLVSEIKLYHEAAVVAGRRERDLATRLGGEIARARVLYEQRVPPRDRGAGDHFHEELVRTLADGDASLLGN